MKLRWLGSAISACAIAAALVACSPPAVESPEAGAEMDSSAAAPQDEPQAAASVRRPERRPGSNAAASSSGQYRYIDERGQVRLAARLEDIPERQRSTASSLSTPPARSRSRALPEEGRAVNTADVTIFTTPSCGYCRAAIAHFKKSGIDYVNRDVSSDEEAHAEYLELTGGRPGVPVIVVGDEWMQGWSQQGFDRLITAAR